MKVHDLTIENLAKLILGDEKNELTVYRNGLELVKIFNAIGFNDEYYGGLPNHLSRYEYTLWRLKEINGTEKMENLVLYLLNPRRYHNTKVTVEEISKNITDILKYDGYNIEKNGEDYIITGKGIIEKDIVEVEANFKMIEENLIKEIQNAKFLIWVSVAWFTNKKILDELIKKHKEDPGIDIQLMISDDVTNEYIEKKYGKKFKFEELFQTYRIKPFGVYDNNILHNKFCVIDLKVVFNGSYNWTSAAEYHSEDYQLTKGWKNASDYANRFKELRMEKFFENLNKSS